MFFDYVIRINFKLSKSLVFLDKSSSIYKWLSLNNFLLKKIGKNKSF